MYGPTFSNCISLVFALNIREETYAAALEHAHGDHLIIPVSLNGCEGFRESKEPVHAEDASMGLMHDMDMASPLWSTLPPLHVVKTGKDAKRGRTTNTEKNPKRARKVPEGMTWDNVDTARVVDLEAF
eukprot:gb/GECG01009321.1/.p1 GENE.gb/GECG01009321.1/~~gb/GECG01009321.1/.p1  ORF type:complete len:128 (+),score=11.07 gb/GECG01009321.1/:1-384(+)